VAGAIDFYPSYLDGRLLREAARSGPAILTSGRSGFVRSPEPVEAMLAYVASERNHSECAEQVIQEPAM